MYILDTNVVSELRKVAFGTANPGVAAWSDTVSPAELYLSAVTIQEIRTGILLLARRDPVRGEALNGWLERQVLSVFSERVLAIDTLVALRAAELHIPKPRSLSDSFIAATGLVHSMIIVTRNTADFSLMGVRLLNPWTEPSSIEP